MGFGNRKIVENRVFLDIETTGFNRTKNYVTIVGLLCNNKFKQYIHKIDLKPYIIDEYIKKNKVTELIGYNLLAFDIDFLVKNHFVKKETIDSLIITDLMHQCRNLGIKGGLKKTEKLFDISREIKPLDFKQQMSIWNRWIIKKDKTLLEPLLTYNKDDVLNLELVEKCIINFNENMYGE